MEMYTVKLNGNAIEYTPSIYGCDDCGYKDTDRSMFYEQNGLLVCSLHLKP